MGEDSYSLIHLYISLFSHFQRQITETTGVTVTRHDRFLPPKESSFLSNSKHVQTLIMRSFVMFFSKAAVVLAIFISSTETLFPGYVS